MEAELRDFVLGGVALEVRRLSWLIVPQWRACVRPLSLQMRRSGDSFAVTAAQNVELL